MPKMRVIRTLPGVAGALLATYHGWLLAGQFMDGRLAEPWLVARWIAAAVLVAVLVTLSRKGYGPASRRSVAVWVLAALLHGPAVVDHYGLRGFDAVLPESVAVLVLQVAAAAASLGLALSVPGLPRRTRQGRPFFVQLIGAPALAGALAGPCSPPFSPRPPPVG